METGRADTIATDYEVAVIGAGPAGLATACAMAHSGIKTVLMAAPHRPAGNRPDTRTAALFKPSLKLLDLIGAWDGATGLSAPMRAIRLVDDTEGVMRAPEVLFDAREIGEDGFGYNVPQTALTASLSECAHELEHLTVIETEGVTSVEPDETCVRITSRERQTLTAQLVAAADGRDSIAREGAGIGTRTHGYEQTAVTCTFKHSRPHDAVSTEFHRRAGPCTVVPLPGNASSLVWVERPAVAQRLYDLSDQQFMKTLERQLRGLLGSISGLSPRAQFPLKAMTADTMGANRVALIGEAAHVMPPIGAQGLNLSFRDAATLAGLVRDAKQAGQPLGGPDVLEAYNSKRGFDVRSRGLMVDILNRALTTNIAPLQLARGLGLHAIKALPPLKHALMREGMQPGWALPDLMKS
ncbi:MAG: FAD-dependent monooxygenase [Pseudomonadota bacterium]